MLLSEAKEILRKNGYCLDEQEMTADETAKYWKNFREMREKVAKALVDEYGFSIELARTTLESSKDLGSIIQWGMEEDKQAKTVANKVIIALANVMAGWDPFEGIFNN